MLHIAICDDMAAYGDKLAGVVEEWAAGRNLKIMLSKYLSGEELLADMEDRGCYDIVLLDIDLQGGISGILVAEKIREVQENTCLIFISEYDDYYREVFHLRAFHYMQKRLSDDKIMECLDKAVDSYRYTNEIFAFRFKRTAYSIKLKDILYFVSDKRTITVVMENGKEYMFYNKLDDLEKQLERYHSRFLRIHKSFLVNAGQVEECGPGYILMRNQDKLPISTEKRGDVVRFHKELLKMFG